MKQFIGFVVKAFVTGLLILVPVYLSVLLLLKAMHSAAGLARPFANLLPEWLPAEHLLSLLLVLIVCFLIGAAARTSAGRALQERIEKSFFERIPGYALFRSLTQRLAGKDEENVWKPALAEIEEARPRVYYRRTGGRTLHGFRALDTHAFRRRCLYSYPGSGAPPGCPLHTGDPDCLPVGIRFKRTCRSDENRERSEVGPELGACCLD